MSSRVAEVVKKVKAEKIIGVELVPDNRFFVEIAKIPQGQVIHFLANTTNIINILIRYCQEVGIDHLSFIAVPYDEISESEVRNILQGSRYIVTGETILSLIRQKYNKWIRQDAHVIAMRRFVNLETAASLKQWVTQFTQQQFMIRVRDHTG
jgi:hypothetical protein